MKGCTNCKGEPYPWNILCHVCLDRYFKGEAVKGTSGMIQNFDGPPIGWVGPSVPQLELQL